MCGLQSQLWRVAKQRPSCFPRLETRATQNLQTWSVQRQLAGLASMHGPQVEDDPRPVRGSWVEG